MAIDSEMDERMRSTQELISLQRQQTKEYRISMSIFIGVNRHLSRANSADMAAVMETELDGHGPDGGVYLNADDRKQIIRLVAGFHTGPAGAVALKKLRGF